MSVLLLRRGALALLMMAGTMADVFAAPRPACALASGIPTGFGPGSASQPNSAGMKSVPAGRFRLGSDSGYAEERGGRAVDVPAFMIDEHEVTNAQFAAFVRATGYITDAERNRASAVFITPKPGQPITPYGWWKLVSGADWRHPQGPGSSIVYRQNHPVVQVTYADANAYARWLGRNLPSEIEWEYAARGGQNEKQASVADAAQGNTAEFQRLLQKTANTWQGSFPDRNTARDGWIGTAPAGCFAPNGFGLHDMIGNVWELTGDIWKEDHAADDPDTVQLAQQVKSGLPRRTIKGGSFLCAPDFCVRYRASSRQPQDAAFGTSHVGFRTALRSDAYKRYNAPTDSRR